MKKRIVNYVVVILAAILLASCTPRVLTDITMSYPARSVEEVKVYDVGDTVPWENRDGEHFYKTKQKSDQSSGLF